MRAKFIFLMLLGGLVLFLNFWNANRIVRQTKELAKLETEYSAVKNINTELRVELDELRSGRNIASLVRVELSDFVPKEEQGRIIYVHEPADEKAKGGYCIIDLFAAKAHAQEVQIMMD